LQRVTGRWVTVTGKRREGELLITSIMPLPSERRRHRRPSLLWIVTPRMAMVTIHHNSLSRPCGCFFGTSPWPRRTRGRQSVSAEMPVGRTALSRRGGRDAWRRDRQAYAARIPVSAEQTANAPADAIYHNVGNMQEHHPHFLPPAFSGGQGGIRWRGAGPITGVKPPPGHAKPSAASASSSSSRRIENISPSR
jgi:hypothetical protein